MINSAVAEVSVPTSKKEFEYSATVNLCTTITSFFTEVNITVTLFTTNGEGTIN